jgi:chromosome partitioning protein
VVRVALTTFLCAPIEKWEEFKRKNGTIANVYRRHVERKALDTKRFIWKAPIHSAKQRITGLDLIPCDVELLGEDLGGGHVGGSFPGVEMLKRQASLVLRDRLFVTKMLSQVENDYDYILIDCPPNLYLMTQSALAASKWYVVTAIPDHLSTIGLSILQRKVQKIGELLQSTQVLAAEGGSVIDIAQRGGIIFVRVRIGGDMITNVHATTISQVKRLVGQGVCFSTHTTELIGYGEAAESSVPVWMLNTPNAIRAAKKHEYEEITKEFLQRF